MIVSVMLASLTNELQSIKKNKAICSFIGSTRFSHGCLRRGSDEEEPSRANRDIADLGLRV